MCSQSEGRIRSNIDIFDFEIDDADMCKIDSLETDERVEAYSYVRQAESLKGA